jgi:hypothetical protein
MNDFNMGNYGGDNSDDDEEEAEGEVHEHGENCKHDDEEAKADLNDLEGDVDPTKTN